MKSQKRTNNLNVFQSFRLKMHWREPKNALFHIYLTTTAKLATTNATNILLYNQQFQNKISIYRYNEIAHFK